jgi:REP-associated tyrosine transposase
MVPRRPPRLPDSEYTGAVRIFLTMCTFDRLLHFTSSSAVDIALRELLRTAAACGVEVGAYCFMPDHFHALAAGESEQANLRRFFDKFRQRSGYYHRQLAGQRLWQEGYFDRSLRKEEDTFDVVSYILANPVRAGLCEAAVDYPFSGSSRYSLNEIATFVQWRP